MNKILEEFVYEEQRGLQNQRVNVVTYPKVPFHGNRFLLENVFIRFLSENVAFAEWEKTFDDLFCC